MTVKERILTIRLLDKAQKYPCFAQTLGMEPGSLDVQKRDWKMEFSNS